MKKPLCTFMLACSAFALQAQTTSENAESAMIDSLYIVEAEEKEEPEKVLHAEPLYIDLIRDLGARKGEQEWNVGFGIFDKNDHDEYTAMVEYEFAPINRLGFEVELPFSIYYPTAKNAQTPGTRLNSIKLAT